MTVVGSTRPTFNYSIRNRAIGWSLLAIVGLLYFYSVYLEPGTITQDSVLVLIGFIPELRLARFWLRQLWTAQFYDDHFEIHGRKEAGKFAYSGVVRVVFKKGFLGSVRLVIVLKGRKAPLSLDANPINKQLKISLKDWLQSKVES